MLLSFPWVHGSGPGFVSDYMKYWSLPAAPCQPNLLWLSHSSWLRAEMNHSEIEVLLENDDLGSVILSRLYSVAFKLW